MTVLLRYAVRQGLTTVVMRKFATLLLIIVSSLAFAGESLPAADVWSTGDLTRVLGKEEAPQLLDDWRWLIGAENRPVMITTMGDVFVLNEKTGVVSFVDTLEGKLKPIANSLNAFHERLRKDQEFVDEYFATQRLREARARGLKIGKHEVYSFVHPPVLGGPQTAENLEASDLALHFSLLGQIFQQIQKFPPGTKIEKINLY